MDATMLQFQGQHWHNEAAGLDRQRTTLMDVAMDATMLTRWCYYKDKSDVDATMTRATLRLVRLQGCNTKAMLM